MGNLNVDAGKVEGNAAGISGAAQYFSEEALSPTDDRTTLTANEKGKSTFSESQSSQAAFGTALNQDAANIRSLGASFTEFDEMMGRLAKSR